MGYLKLLQCGKTSVSLYSTFIQKGLCNKISFFYNWEFFLLFSTRAVFNMNCAYFQLKEEQEKVGVNFMYIDKNLRRNFNFERPLVENMESFLQRVECKLQSFVVKKSKKKRKENDVSENLPEVNVSLVINNQALSGEVKFQDIFEKKFSGDIKLIINDVNYDICINYPMVKSMTLPKILLAGTVVCPDTLETEYMDEQDSQYVWYKSKNPLSQNKWEKCGEGFIYSIKENDINYFLKVVCTPKMGNKVGPDYESISSVQVVEFNGFEEIYKRHDYTKEATKPDEFRIVSYNILAQTYTQTKEAKTELFTFCDPEYMDFCYRKTLCISELLGYNADIICLQEVDRSHHSLLKALFSKRGYSSIYHEKKGSREGCAFMYNNCKFSIISSNQYTLVEEMLSNPIMDDIKVKIVKKKNLLERLENISSLIQVVVLKSLLKHVLIIGNIHLYFHPDYDNIRLLQGLLSWRILQNTYNEMTKKFSDQKISILLCGDFNSTPECGFHQFLSSGFVGSDHIDWRSKEDEAIEDLSSQHSFNMKSAYDNTKYTNYITLFKGCLDYIYYQSDHLKLNQTVPIPDEEVLSRCKGIPSKFFPSDHVALIADFKFGI